MAFDCQLTERSTLHYGILITFGMLFTKRNKKKTTTNKKQKLPPPPKKKGKKKVLQDISTIVRVCLKCQHEPGSLQNNHVAARNEPVSIEDGEWHHLLVTVDSGLVEFFLDGQSLSSRLV